eukprot:GHRR01032684.1.p1 GENE.GHRR01032684.1~~GHRR01032684.1.p1  ORF type:complete len:194 (-),score=33.57 GHRR01032684.1:417-998(-)
MTCCSCCAVCWTPAGVKPQNCHMPLLWQRLVICSSGDVQVIASGRICHLTTGVWLCRRLPLWTNWGLLISMILQVAFLIYSLFSVDPFTIKVQTLEGKDPPTGLPNAFRAGLLVIMVVNAVAAIGAELLSRWTLKIIDKVKGSAWYLRHRSGSDPVLQQGLLHPALLSSGGSNGPAGGLHVPTLQPPSGAALL